VRLAGPGEARVLSIKRGHCGPVLRIVEVDVELDQALAIGLDRAAVRVRHGGGHAEAVSGLVCSRNIERPSLSRVSSVPIRRSSTVASWATSAGSRSENRKSATFSLCGRM